MIKAFLKQILDMGSLILSLLYAHYTIDNKKPSINGTLRYIPAYITKMLEKQPGTVKKARSSIIVESRVLYGT